MFKPRPMQRQVLAYRGGRMGVSAVPGSGKTQTLSYLAASLIAEGCLQDDQEVLVVTLVNSAVRNFSARVSHFIESFGLLPNIGYRVRTLHGLAHDIVREHPALVGLANDFQIVAEREAEEILSEAVDAWLRSHPYFADQYLDADLDERRREWVRRDKWPYLVRDLARNFIKQAKDLQATPGSLQDSLRVLHNPPPLLAMGLEIYIHYQRGLAYRGAVDFDDLIRLALKALTLDEDYLKRLQYRWPFILEDEAQDSSQLQEEILRRLGGASGNWVRVGDPNQAIYETFTTANPKFLLDFLQEPGVAARELPNSGRSTQSIIDLANYLVDWCRKEHPVEDVRSALAPNYIKPSPVGDPQPNPEDRPDRIFISSRKLSPQEELEGVVKSLEGWLSAHPDQTAAVLVPRNDRGEHLVDLLKKRGVPAIEMLRSTKSTRQTAGVLGTILRCLAEPASSGWLVAAYKAYRRDDREDEARQGRLDRVCRLLQKCVQVETYLQPNDLVDWLGNLGLEASDPEAYLELIAFQKVMQRWQAATLLPVGQIILTIAQDLFTQAADLALADKLASVLQSAADSHPDWGMLEVSIELASVAKNERKFLGFSEEEIDFDPDKHPGRVVVATMHKAKGLEWDRVYLLSVNNYDFPSALPHDQYISEKWFLRERINLEAEALSQLKALIEKDMIGLHMREGEATLKARLAYTAERLRLLYVGITRARKELVITWNTGQRGDLQPASPLIALLDYWKELNQDGDA